MPRSTWKVLIGLCLLCSFSALGESGLDESSVLLQGRVHVHDSNIPPLPRGGYERLAVRSVLGAVDSYLQNYEVSHRTNLAQATDVRVFMNRYLTNLASFVHLGEGGTEFEESDTEKAGLNSSSLFNQHLGLEVLTTLRSAKAVSSLERGIKQIAEVGTSYSLRMEKHITNLKALAGEAAQDEIPGHIREFFKKQEFVTKHTVQHFGTTIKDILALLPEDFRQFAGFAESITQRLAERSSSDMAMAHEKLLQSTGTNFCTGVKRLSRGLALKYPVLHQATSVFPQLELLAETQMPEVTPTVKRLSKQVQKHVDNLSARLEQDIKFMEETLCSIVPTSL